MIRAEVVELFRKWSEVAAGVGLALIGLFALTRLSLLWNGLGAVAVLTGGGLALAAYRRLQFTHRSEDGPGVVEINEREISYFSAQGGGIVSVDALERVELLSTARGAVHWVLREDSGMEVKIPHAAQGAAGLFDVLLTLRGADYDKARRALDHAQNDSFVIWRKPD